ncbi:MAG: response regulator [Desulfobulbaceae bacterium]|jgi:two-component system chemotaxis response regulator CheY|nr:response regulator [Desulfobulbaceae bacterium]
MAYDTNMKVLVVDDFTAMRRIVKKFLIQLGFKDIVEADDGTTAVDLLKTQKVDLIISDWNMPEMTGLELLQHIRTDPGTEDIPFIMVTTEAQRDDIILAVRAKVSQHIVKPFTAETLGEKLAEVFRGR